jgi:hypothetical protein
VAVSAETRRTFGENFSSALNVKWKTEKGFNNFSALAMAK